MKQHGLRPAVPASSSADEARSRVAGLCGVISAEWDRIDLLVEYDLRLISLDRIEDATAEAGLVLKGGWHRLCREWWKFTEANELANITHSGDGACCNRPPARR